MKRKLSLILAALLCLSLLAAMVACDNGEKPDETTAAETDAPTEQTTEEPTTEETTEAPTDETTEEATTNDASAPVEGAINIGTAEELIAWAKTINEDGTDYFEVTVNFTSDIDLAGYEWIPIDGAYLDCVVFEGNGHTIKNMTIAGTDEAIPSVAHPDFPFGFGFIQGAEYDLEFKNLNFENANITAWERHVGVFVGHIYGAAWITFENCHVSNYTIDGWMEYPVGDQEPSEHSIAFRVAGFVGGNFGGNLEFINCSVTNGKMSGFHNLAAFVGYDASGNINADCFTDCHAENLEMTFSYCQSDSYTVDMPRKFVSVFFNHAQWIDKVEACIEMGNTFEGVSYYDWTDDNAEYTPADFASWSEEEANPPA